MVICLIQQGIHKGRIDNFDIVIYVYLSKLKTLLRANVINDVTAALFSKFSLQLVAEKKIPQLS